MTTGEKLQKLRKDNNYTQEELADIMNVSRQSISKWESDLAFPETEKLIALSKLYHCTIDYLLNTDNNDITSETNSFSEKTGVETTNKKRLPFIITCISAHISVLILFFCPWFKVVLDGSNFYNVNYFEMVFFMTQINEQPLPNIFALISFLAIVTTLILLVVLIFVNNKAINTTIRIMNIIIPFIILGSMFFVSAEWVITSLIVGFIYAALIICQFAVKPLRLTQANSFKNS
jgi:transcriptional regulator with XRE-family HTH domain